MRKEIWIGIVLLVLVFHSCKQSEADKQWTGEGKYKVLATTGMIADMVTNIAGDDAEVESLLGPGIDPHIYKASPSDLDKMKDANVIFYNGLHLEGKMGEVLNKLSLQKPVVAIGDSLEKEKLLLVSADNESGAYDPHIWFDAEIWIEMAEVVCKSLEAFDPDNAEGYQERKEAYIARVKELNSWIEQQVATIPAEQRILITAHDAFSYFGNAYGIEVKGIQGVSTLAEFGLRDVTSLVDVIVSRNIKAIFVETSVSERAINAVVEGCRDRGHDVVIGGSLYSDALGDENSEAGTWEGMLRYNVSTIVSALK